MSDETTALVARIRELADGEDPADVEALVGRIENLHPAKRILLALRGHRIGRDERVVALLDAIDSVAACTFASGSLEDVLLDLDEWSAFQAESFGLDRDLFDSETSPLDAAFPGRRPSSELSNIVAFLRQFRVQVGRTWVNASAELRDPLRLEIEGDRPLARAKPPRDESCWMRPEGAFAAKFPRFSRSATPT